jgi:hypothetical protein
MDLMEIWYLNKLKFNPFLSFQLDQDLATYRWPVPVEELTRGGFGGRYGADT